MEFFGYNITKKKADVVKDVTSKVRAELEDGAVVVAGNNVFGISFDAEYADQKQLIDLYRTMALDGFVSNGIDDVVNEAIVPEENVKTVSLDLSLTDFSESIKVNIAEEFEEVSSLLKFAKEGQAIFRKWYVDGIIYAFKKLETEKKNDQLDGLIRDKKGLSKIKILDPRDIKFIREEVVSNDGNIMREEEYYLYTDSKLNSANVAIKISIDSIARITSGLTDEHNRVISNLHQAIKPYNQLIALEDSVVVYRMVRAPERRIFFVDVGELPKTQAEQYMKSIMNQHKNKMVYDSNTGKMSEKTNMRSMLEDVWLPRRDGGRGTDVQTLQGGANLGEMDDVEYFQKRLFNALKIPTTRLNDDNAFSLGNSAEITREELKFNKHVTRLRTIFSGLFFDILKTQLIVKKVITVEEWFDNANEMFIVYNDDSHFSELKEAELLELRLNNLGVAVEYVGKYFSETQLHKDIMRRTDEDILKLQKEIKEEGSEPKEEDDE